MYYENNGNKGDDGGCKPYIGVTGSGSNATFGIGIETSFWNFK